MRKDTLQSFIQKANNKHHSKYDYSKALYVDSKTKLCVICPQHGEYMMRPNNHLLGQGCPVCGEKQSILKRSTNLAEFTKRATSVHNGKYSYIGFDNEKKYKRVIAKCPTHGIFRQSMSDHLDGHGCPLCRKEKISNALSLTTDEFISRARVIHNNQYDYSKVEYKGQKEKVCIICPKHGEFWQLPNNHLLGAKCKKCSDETNAEKRKDSLDDFIRKARKKHGYKYDYSQSEYVSAKSLINIICPKHGLFTQKASDHTNNGKGCPRCQQSHLEEEVEIFLQKFGVRHIYQANKKMLPWIGLQSLDFYLPDYKVGIECQGEQHFIVKDFFGGLDGFNKIKELDTLKEHKCKENGVTILYYTNIKLQDYPYKVFTDKKILLEEIKKVGTL